MVCIYSEGLTVVIGRVMWVKLTKLTVKKTLKLLWFLTRLPLLVVTVWLWCILCH